MPLIATLNICDSSMGNGLQGNSIATPSACIGETSKAEINKVLTVFFRDSDRFAKIIDMLLCTESQTRKNAMDNWERQWKEADGHMRSVIANRDVKRNQRDELQQQLKRLRQQRRQ